jgi:hypothetical protein
MTTVGPDASAGYPARFAKKWNAALTQKLRNPDAANH